VLTVPAEEQRTLSHFTVHLPVFEGPFELLLSLISKHRLDVTEIALSVVTDEFLSFIHHQEGDWDQWDLGQATEFLVVAATLLDLKVSRLLPGEDNDDAEDLALLEARDLLFARLLQYRAYKQAAALMLGLLDLESRHHPRTAGPEEIHLATLPDVVIGVDPDRLASIAARALTPRPEPELPTSHVHAPKVNIAEQMAIIVAMLGRDGVLPFGELCRGCQGLLEVVGRFLGVLELFRDGQVVVEQAEALAELLVRRDANAPIWSGANDVSSDDGDVDNHDGAATPAAGARTVAGAGG
jgi:segregation and condensation protein A